MISNSFKERSCRGSVLLVALCFASLIAIALASYISLGNNSLKQASRSFYGGSGINLAEIGLEMAVACFNQLDDTTPGTAWAGWTLDNTPYNASTSPFTPCATRTFTGFNPGPGATGTIKVFAQHYEGSTPTTTPRIVVQSTITQNSAPPIHKYVEVTLRKRSLLGYGVSAIDDVRVVGGNFEGKSWDSDPEEDGTLVPYNDTNNTANLIVGSVQGDINLGGGEIWGYTKVSDPTHTDVGGSVHGLDSTTNDPERRTDDFSANFPMPSSPSYAYTPVTSAIQDTVTFPFDDSNTNVTVPAGQVNAGEQVYVYKFIGAAANIDLQGGTKHLSIAPGRNVILILEDHADEQAIMVSGNSDNYVEIGAGGSLHIYSNGNITIAGSGALNNNIDAKSFMIYGTNTTPGQQDIKVAGNGQYTGVVYAPNADVEVKGGGSGGEVIGAIVGKTVYFNGNTHFYYDEELSDLTMGNPYGASKWKELQTAAERAFYATALNF